jgi:hypothetical protein
MDDPRSLEIDGVGGGRGEEEQQITEVGNLFRSLRFILVWFLTYSFDIHITLCRLPWE